MVTASVSVTPSRITTSSPMATKRFNEIGRSWVDCSSTMVPVRVSSILLQGPMSEPAPTEERMMAGMLENFAVVIDIAFREQHPRINAHIFADAHRRDAISTRPCFSFSASVSRLMGSVISNDSGSMIGLADVQRLPAA